MKNASTGPWQEFVSLNFLNFETQTFAPACECEESSNLVIEYNKCLVKTIFKFLTIFNCMVYISICCVGVNIDV